MLGCQQTGADLVQSLPRLLHCYCLLQLPVCLQPVFLSEGNQLLQQARQEMEALAEFVTSAQVCARV